jgi:serine protease
MKIPGLVLITLMGAFAATSQAQPQEYNGSFRAPSAQASNRLIVKWRDGASEAVASTRARSVGQRKGIPLERKSSITERLEVLQLERTLDADELASVVQALSSDPQIEFVAPDLRRHIHRLPADPLVADQWYLLGQQPSATRTEQAWDETIGAVTTVVAVIDTGVRFEHPDLGRASEGGKLLPGYDFVSLPRMANDGDGWDPDPSDPGDWVTSADLRQPGFGNCEVSNSSWHGTRVAGMIGAATDNAGGIAGAGWNTLILPVRALGKCGGFDSDIIAAMRWAAGLPVNGVPLNPTPAKIVNLSLGSEGACTQLYQQTVNELAERGVLVVASVGNEGGPVSAPANCVGAVGVAGLRHVGTKVGFSNLGTEVTLGAPGGNCVNTGFGQPCLFSLITTSNNGATSPGNSIYTSSLNYNVGTSFSAPLVAGAAALMHSVNSRLGPAQLTTLLKETATPFPQSTAPGVPVCRVPSGPADVQAEECACTTQTCGAGMLNTHAAVLAALRPFASMEAPQTLNPGSSAAISAAASIAADGRNIVGYQWSVLDVVGATPTIADPTAVSTSIEVAGNSQFVLRLTVTDDASATDVEELAISTPVAPTTPAPPATPDPPNTTPSAPSSSSGGGGGQLDIFFLGVLLLLSAIVALARDDARNHRV